MKAYLYTYNGKLNKIYKELTPFQIPQIEFTFKTPYNELNPVIIVKIPYNIIEGVNYVKLDYYGYTVTSYTAINKNLTKMHLSYDFIYNIRLTDIINSYGFINRYGGVNIKDRLLYDDKVPLSMKNNVTTTYLTQQPVYEFDGDNIYMVLSGNFNIPKGIEPTTNLKLMPIPNNMSPYKNILIYRLSETTYSRIIGEFLSSPEKASFVLGIYKAPKFLTDETINWYDMKQFGYLVFGTTPIPLTESDECFLLESNSYVKDFIIDNFVTYKPNFMDIEPIAKYELYLPMYGFIDISYNILIGKRLIIRYAFDYTTFTLGITIATANDSGVLQTENIINKVYADFGTSLPITYNNSANVERQTKANTWQMVGAIAGAALTIGIGIATGGAGLAAGMAANSLMGMVSARNASQNKEYGGVNANDILNATDYENSAMQSKSNARIGSSVANGIGQVAQAGIQFYTHQLFNVSMGGGNISGGGTYLKFYECQYIYLRETKPQLLDGQSEEVYKKMIGYPMQQFCSDLSQYINENNKGLFISISDFNFADNVIGLTLDKLQGLQAALEIGVEI